MNRKTTATLVLLGLMAPPALAEGYAVNWWSIDGGGSVGTVSGGGYVLSGTIGQHDAGRAMTGGTYGVQGGFWTAGMGITTDVPDADGDNGDGEATGGSPGLVFRAHGSAPNPFRTQATVSFDLPGRHPVHLAIYDASGRHCRTLIDGSLEAGRHDRVWDGHDGAGRIVASGVYFAVLQTPFGQHREKLVKLR